MLNADNLPLKQVKKQNWELEVLEEVLGVKRVGEFVFGKKV